MLSALEVELNTTGASSAVLTTLLSLCLEALHNRPKLAKPAPDHRSDNGGYRDEMRSVADDLAKRVRVLCWVMTHPNNHRKKAQHVKATWGKRCNTLLFMSTAEDAALPAIQLPGVREGRRYLWAKTKEAFRYVYQYHREEADWFLKAEDDTYVVVENLRFMLSKYNSMDPLYIGCRLKSLNPQGYMDGGAGYVLSRGALDRFVHFGLSSPDLCEDSDTGYADVEMGVCLENIGVKAVDSRDNFGRGRFFPLLPREHLVPSKDYRFRHYWKNIYYPADEGLDCCSNYAVSFHQVEPELMYVYDYFIYSLRPYGITMV